MRVMPSPFAPEGPWLFGRRTDLAVFGGSALLSFALLGVGAATGALETESPEWVWWACVLGVDVAHVWSTAFRVYLDKRELHRRPVLYIAMPIGVYALGVLLHAIHSNAFWTVLAYFAVFHFIRQQIGWARLYHRRTERAVWDRRADLGVLYIGTLFPMLWWHGHLPRRFHWFLEGDFVVPVSEALADTLMPVYLGALLLWAARQLFLASRGAAHLGLGVLVTSTSACWGVGILVFDSDYAFTVTNVLIHGIPYLALTYAYGRARAGQSEPEPANAEQSAQQESAKAHGQSKQGDASTLRRLLSKGVLGFLAFVLLAALIEEIAWDRLVWHERDYAFGAGGELSPLWLTFVVPLLSLPQAAHYALDGFVWRRRGNE